MMKKVKVLMSSMFLIAIISIRLYTMERNPYTPRGERIRKLEKMETPWLAKLKKESAKLHHECRQIAVGQFAEWLANHEELKIIPVPTAEHGYKGDIYYNLFVQDSDGQGYFVSMVGNENTVGDIINRFNKQLETSGDNTFIKLVALETGTVLRDTTKVGNYKKYNILRDNQVLRIYRQRDYPKSYYSRKN